MTLWIIISITLYIFIGLALFKFTQIGREVIEEYRNDYETLGVLILLWPGLMVSVIFTPIIESIGKIASKIILKEE